MNKYNLHGIVVPLLTPFTSNDAIDEDGVRRLTRRMVAAGVHGVFPCGSSGEFWVLDDEERCRIIQTVVAEAAGDVLVYAGVGAVGTRQAIKLTRCAEEGGADALVVITPFYINPTQEELYHHYAAIARSTSLPVIPYNNPSRTGNVNLEPATMARLAEIENLAGIKDSSGNIGQTADYITLCPPGFAVFQGRDDMIFPSMVLGAVGGVAAEGNVAPEMCVELYDAFMANDWERSKAVQVKLAKFRRALAWGTYPAALKTAMTMIGEPMGAPRSPAAALPAAYLDRLRQILINLDLNVVA